MEGQVGGRSLVVAAHELLGRSPTTPPAAAAATALQRPAGPSTSYCMCGRRACDRHTSMRGHPLVDSARQGQAHNASYFRPRTRGTRSAEHSASPLVSARRVVGPFPLLRRRGQRPSAWDLRPKNRH
eukprot:363163-Chlamydomonas_euryale.AAC.2